jgi:MFS family permease
LPTTPDQLTPADRERTLRLSVREGMVWSVMWGFGEAYIAPFAVFLKAGPTAMALLGTLPGLLGAAGQWLGAIVMERTRRRRTLVVATHVIQGLAFVPLYLIPLLFPSVGAAAVVTVFSISTLLFSGGGPIWISLMGDVVPEDRRGRFFGSRNRTVMAGMVISMLLAALVMSRAKAWGIPWTGFGLLFGLAAAARLACSRLMRKHADPPLALPPVTGARGLAWWSRLRGSPFAYFALVHTVLNGAVMVAGPFFPLYMLRDLQWDYLRFTTMTVAFLLAQISVVHWWGALCDRHGNRVVYLTTSLLAPLPMLAWFASTDFRVLLGAQLISGALSGPEPGRFQLHVRQRGVRLPGARDQLPEPAGGGGERGGRPAGRQPGATAPARFRTGHPAPHHAFQPAGGLPDRRPGAPAAGPVAAAAPARGAPHRAGILPGNHAPLRPGPATVGADGPVGVAGEPATIFPAPRARVVIGRGLSARAAPRCRPAPCPPPPAR